MDTDLSFFKKIPLDLKQNQLNITSSEMFTSTPGIQRKKQIDTAGSENFTDILTEHNKQLEYRLNESLASNEKVQKKFEKYQEEMLTTNKMLNEEIETFRKNNSELSLKLALSESKLESALEKCKTLNTSTEKHKKELDSSKERMSKLNEMIIKHEQSINLTTQELNRTKEKLNEFETKLHTVTVEKDLYKSNQDRLSKENELLSKENSSRSSILSNLEMIRNSCDRNERETKIIYTQKIEQLERDNLILKKQTEHDQEQHSTIVKSWKSQYDQLVDEHQKLNTEHDKTAQLLAETRAESERLHEKYNDAEAKLRSNELLVQMTRNTKSSSAISRLTHLEEETKDLNMKLSLAEKEIVSLKIQLEDTKGHSKQYKTIADSMERAVKEASEMNEKSKQIYEGKLSELDEQLKQLQAERDVLASEKSELETRTTLEKQTFEANIETLNSEKAQLISDLDTLQRKFENTEKILEDRSKDRDDYVAKIGVLEEQLSQYSDKLIQDESCLEDKSNRLNEVALELEAKNSEIEQCLKAQQDLKLNYESNERVMQESIAGLQNENQGLINQINMLQQELARMGQDIIALQNQDTFKLSAGGGESSEEKMQVSDDAKSASSSNLLEINRYLRTQKDQLEEKCENLNLNFEINQQRLKTAENELEFYRKKSQQHEDEIKHLKTSTKEPGASAQSDESQMNLENLNLTISNNRRLKEECDSLTSEVSKLNDEIRAREEEFTNLKASLSGSELKNESIMGENTCLKEEIKKWKDRVDALMRSSDMGQEWVKIQAELQEAHNKNQELTDMINELRNSLADWKGKAELAEREKSETIAQMATDKAKAQQDLDALRSDRLKRDEMFKTLVSELKDVVTAVQKELQINIDWGGMKGPQSERMIKIKEELGTIKKLVVEKIDELRSKGKISEETAGEMSSLRKRIEEGENKLKEKDIKIGQMNNFIGTTKTKISAQQKTIADQQKEISDLKTSLTQHQAAAQVEHQPAEPTVSKAEFDNVRSKLLQSQIDFEKLKKEVQEAKLNMTSAPTTSIAAQAAQPAQVTSSPSKQQQTAAPTSSVASSASDQQQQPPPTAYIAPSRITKLVQAQPQPTTSSTAPSLRRTAAVQPTPHDPGQNQANRQQFVSPFSENAANQWANQSQTLSTTSEASFADNQQSSQPDLMANSQQAAEPTSSSMISSTPSTSSAPPFMAKRNREEDQVDDSLNASGSFSSFKKQRSSLEQASSEADQQIQQNVATIEPFIAMNPIEADPNEYIVIGDEMQSSEVQELQEVIQQQQDEIVLDEGTDSDYEDVIITNVNRNQNLQQNVLSSTSTNQNIQIAGEQSNYQEDEASVDEAANQGIEEEESQQETNEDTVIDENTVESNGDEEIVEDVDRSDELHLEMPADEETEENVDVNLRPSSETNEQDNNFQVEDAMSQDNNANKESNDDSESNYEDVIINQEEIQGQQSPDNSTPQTSQQDQQQQNSQTTSQPESTAQIRAQQMSETGGGSTFISTRPQFGASGTLQPQLERPKPIVWDGATSTTQQFQPVSNPMSSQTGSYKIRRTPLVHNMPNFQQQQAGSQSQPSSQEYFQNEFQQQSFQSSQFRLQNNSRFQFQASNLTGGANMLQGSGNQMMMADSSGLGNQTVQQQQLMNAQRSLMRNAPRAQLNTQQPGRIIPTMNPRGGGNVGNNPTGQMSQRGGLNRGGGATGPGGRGTRQF